MSFNQARSHNFPNYIPFNKNDSNPRNISQNNQYPQWQGNQARNSFSKQYDFHQNHQNSLHFHGQNQNNQNFPKHLNNKQYQNNFNRQNYQNERYNREMQDKPNQNKPNFHRPNFTNNQNSFYKTKKNAQQNKCTKAPNGKNENNQDSELKSKGAFWCQPCARDFISQPALAAHEKTHIQCQFKDCKFTASNKAVSLHFIQNHAEGKFRIVLETPEDIAKWREDRKRCYPTVSNVAKKKRLGEEQIKAGIQVETKEYVYRTESKRGRGRGRGRNGKTFIQERRPKQNQPGNDLATLQHNESTAMKANSDQFETKTENGSDTKISTTSSAELKNNEGESTDTKNKTGKLQQQSQEKLSEKEDGEIIDEETITSLKDTTNKPIDTNEIPRNIEEHCNRNKKQKKKRGQSDNNNNKRRVSLLEMLLAKDIRHERNVILQCIRYIVNEDFFEEKK